MFRGRNPSIQSTLIVKEVLKHKEEIICKSNRSSIVSKTNFVWPLICQQLGNNIKPTTLYSYVINDKFNLKKILLGITHENETIKVSANSDPVEKFNFTFTITFKKAEFDKLVVQKVSKGDKNNKRQTRFHIVNVLNPKKWTKIIAEKLYNRVPHLYHFKSIYINRSSTSGGFQGFCKCGSQLKSQILPPIHKEIIKIKISTAHGNEKCGKLGCGKTSKKLSGLEKYKKVEDTEDYESNNQKNYKLVLNDQSPYTKSCILPIIRNGSTSIPSIKFVTINQAKLSFSNTCAFDSIFQILLAATTDNKKIKTHLQKHSASNDLFELVLDVAETAIQMKTYQKRAKILLHYFKKTAKPNSLVKINCACNVVSLANFIFKNTPSFKEIAVCPTDSSSKIKELPSVTIAEDEMSRPLGQVLREHIVLPGVRCGFSNCKTINYNEIYDMSNIIMIGVDINKSIEFKKIPDSFACPKTKEKYALLGVVNYEGAKTNKIGHYTAITKINGNWIVCNDLNQKTYSIRKEKQLRPELLIYSKFY